MRSPILAVIMLTILGATAWAQSPIPIDVGDAATIEKMDMLANLKDLASSVIFFVLCPTSGALLSYKGIKLIGDSERGGKGPGVVALICGILMFILPKIIQELVEFLGAG